MLPRPSGTVWISCCFRAFSPAATRCLLLGGGTTVAIVENRPLARTIVVESGVYMVRGDSSAKKSVEVFAIDKLSPISCSKP